MKVRVESSHKERGGGSDAVDGLPNHAARDFAGDFLVVLRDAELRGGSNGLDLGDDTQRQTVACPARSTFLDVSHPTAGS